MKRLMLILLIPALAACGVQRPLMKPKDIPAFDARQQAKRDKIAQEQQDEAEKAAAEKAAVDARAPVSP